MCNVMCLLTHNAVSAHASKRFQRLNILLARAAQSTEYFDLSQNCSSITAAAAVIVKIR